MARPKKHPDERTRQRNMRLPVVKDAFMSEQAAIAGLSFTDYVIALADEQKLKPAASPVTLEAVRELNRLGVNFQQVHKRLNATGQLAHDARAVIAKIDEALGRLLDEL